MDPKKKYMISAMLSIFAGMCCHLILGAFYLWGAIVLYVTSYYKKHYDEGLTSGLAQAVFPIMGLAINLTFPLGIKLSEKIGIRSSILILSAGMAGCVFISSFMSNFWIFVFFYGILFGFLGGLMYMIPILNAVSYYPNKKGIISGVILACFGFGAVFTSFMAQAMINPEDYQPMKVSGEKVFQAIVYERVPSCLRYLSLYYLCLSITATICIVPKNMDRPDSLQSQQSAEKKNEDSLPISLLLNDSFNKLSATKEGRLDNERSVQDGKKYQSTLSQENKVVKVYEENPAQLFTTIPSALKSWVFTQIFFMMFLTSGFGLLIAVNFKTYAIELINDEFLTFVGSLGAIANSGSRFLWGGLMDRFQFKYIYVCMLLVQILMICSIHSIVPYSKLYCVWVCVIYMCEGAHFVLFPPLAMKIFGVKLGSVVYGYLFWSLALSNLLQFGIVYFLKDSWGFEGIFWFYLALTCLGLAFGMLFRKVD